MTEERELLIGKLHRMDLQQEDAYIHSQARTIDWVTIYRVCGDIAVSRSIGDIDYKGFSVPTSNELFLNWPPNHNQQFTADLIIPHPECVSVDLTDEHEFLILACDGLWDVLTPEEAVKRTRQYLAEGKSLTKASEDLCDFALRCGSGDNVTAIIVQFSFLN